MFKNRALQVKMVKNDKEETPRFDRMETFLDNAATMSVFVSDVLKTVGKTVLVYVAADTIRQVMVEHAKK